MPISIRIPVNPEVFQWLRVGAGSAVICPSLQFRLREGGFWIFITRRICRSERMERISTVELTYKNKSFFKSGNSDLNLKIEFKPTEADL